MILATNQGAVRELRLNRPPVNALNMELIAALRKAVEASSTRRRPRLDSFGCPGQVFRGPGCATPARLKLLSPGPDLSGGEMAMSANRAQRIFGGYRT